MQALRAELPWYDHPSTASGLDAFWGVVRDALRADGHGGIPDALHRGRDFARAWRDARLVLSQCCGPDLYTDAGAALTPIARPVFADLDVEAGAYFSHIVGRLPATGPPRLVINAPNSRSGHGALRQWLAAQGITAGAVAVSGSHAASLDALRRGDADVAAIDAHSWRWLPHTGLEIIGRSSAAPSPPWVRHRACPVPLAALRAALTDAVAQAGDAIAICALVPPDAPAGRADHRVEQPADQ